MPINLSNFLSSTYIGKRGFGLFNIEIGASASYTCTTTMASALTLPSSAGKYLVRSILLTNISGNDATFSAEVLLNSTSNTINIAEQIPLNSGSSIELIKKPKILSPSDQIRLSASANSAVSAYITYQNDESLNYFGTGTNLNTSSPIEIFTASQGDAIIESIQVTSILDKISPDIDVYIADASGTPISYIVKSLVLPSNSLIELNEQPKFILAGQKLFAKSVSNTASILISGIYK